MKILVVYASSGLGHKKAAEGIYQALSKKDKNFKYYLVDLLKYSSSAFSFLYSDFYIFLIKNLKYVWGYIFYLTNKGLFYSLFSYLGDFFVDISTKSFQHYLIKENFDVIISTHFSSSYIVGCLKRKKLIDSKLITVVTDYRVHSIWIEKESDYFVVACHKTKEDLVKKDIALNKIKVFGIPIRLDFSINKDANSIRKKLSIEPKQLTFLVMSGAVGIGPYEYFLRKFAKFKDRINLIFICGHNEKLFKHLKNISKRFNLPFKIYQFVDNIDELMQISDIIITKAGGISLTEALVKKLPMLVISPIPGQEKLNSDFMSSLGIMEIAKGKKEAFNFLKLIIDNPDILEKMKKNTDKISKPKATEEVVRLAREIA